MNCFIREKKPKWWIFVWSFTIPRTSLFLYLFQFLLLLCSSDVHKQNSAFVCYTCVSTCTTHRAMGVTYWIFSSEFGTVFMLCLNGMLSAVHTLQWRWNCNSRPIGWVFLYVNGYFSLFSIKLEPFSFIRFIEFKEKSINLRKSIIWTVCINTLTCIWPLWTTKIDVSKRHQFAPVRLHSHLSRDCKNLI